MERIREKERLKLEKMKREKVKREQEKREQEKREQDLKRLEREKMLKVVYTTIENGHDIFVPILPMGLNRVGIRWFV